MKQFPLSTIREAWLHLDERQKRENDEDASEELQVTVTARQGVAAQEVVASVQEKGRAAEVVVEVGEEEVLQRKI